MDKPPERIRVLQLIKGLDIGGVNGGAERFAIDLACALDRKRFEPLICAFFIMKSAPADAWRQRIAASGVKLLELAPWQGNDRFGNYLRAVSALRRHLAGRPVQVAHSHFQLGTLAALWLKFTGMAEAALRTAHIRKEWSSGWYGVLRRQLLTRGLFPAALDAEVGVSQDLVADLQSHRRSIRGRRPPQFIANAIDLRFPDDLCPPEDWQKPPGERWVGVISRLAEQKGHRFLIEAAPQVLKAVPAARFLVVGDGELRAQLDAQVGRLGLEERVHLLGQRSDVPALLSQLDLFVLPSLWEGLPTVAMEAMLAGVPVLASDVPGTRELVQHGISGYLFPPGDAVALASWITRLLTEPELGTAVLPGSRAALERVSIQNVAQQYQQLYLDLLGKAA